LVAGWLLDKRKPPLGEKDLVETNVIMTPRKTDWVRSVQAQGIKTEMIIHSIPYASHVRD
jgi:hypothetical protein